MPLGTFLYTFLGEHVSISLSYISRSSISGPMVTQYLTFGRNATFFSTSVASFCAPSVWGFQFLHVVFFPLCLYLSLWLSASRWVWTASPSRQMMLSFFDRLTSSLYILFGDMSIQVLSPFVIRLLVFLSVSYWSPLYILDINPYQTCGLQMLSPFHQLTFHAVDCVLWYADVFKIFW